MQGRVAGNRGAGGKLPAAFAEGRLRLQTEDGLDSGLSYSTLGSRPPVFHQKVLEALEVLSVRRDENEPMHLRNRCDLAVDEWCRGAELLQASPFVRVVLCRSLVVGENGKGRLNDSEKVSLDPGAFLRRRQQRGAEDELVPDRRGDGDHRFVFS